MNGSFRKCVLQAAVSLALLGGFGGASAIVNVQCPGDTDGDAVIDDINDPNYLAHPTATCMHLIAGDGFAVMSDGSEMYTFGFGDQTGTPPNQVIANGILNNEWVAPTIELEEGDEFYLSLTNVGTTMRPDLFDPHTVHFHGFPNAATVFDGVPEVSISINMGSTLTYYYNIAEPGTHFYHCHVEVTEHMEMGMEGNLYIHPRQDRDGCASGACPVAERMGGDTTAPMGYVYNDDDGTTAWDVEKAILLAGFDSAFHEASLNVQPLPFATIESDYPMFNGRGYPDTVNTNFTTKAALSPEPSQKLDSYIEVTAGEKVLLRLSNLSLDRLFTLTAPGLTLKQVGKDARLMRGADGKNLYVEMASLNSGGGEHAEVLIDTTGVAPGTYFLQTTELHQMSNRNQMDGGMITEIVVN